MSTAWTETEKILGKVPALPYWDTKVVVEKARKHTKKLRAVSMLSDGSWLGSIKTGAGVTLKWLKG